MINNRWKLRQQLKEKYKKKIYKQIIWGKIYNIEIN